MKIVIINGSPRKGITYQSMRVVQEEMLKLGEVEFVEFHLPQDLPLFCRGCFRCFEQGENYCPDAALVQPIVQALLAADGWIIGSPSYALQLSAGLKTLFDHLAYCFLNHRPRFFRQKALVITTAAGAGAGSTGRYIAQNLSFWGVNKIHRYGQAVMAAKWNEMPEKPKVKLQSNLRRLAQKFYRDLQSEEMHSPSLTQSIMFNAGKALVLSFSDNNADKQYWSEQDWLNKGSKYFVEGARLDPVKRLAGRLTSWAFGRMMRQHMAVSPNK